MTSGIYVLEIAQLAKERPCSDDGESEPETPDDTT